MDVVRSLAYRHTKKVFVYSRIGGGYVIHLEQGSNVCFVEVNVDGNMGPMLTSCDTKGTLIQELEPGQW